MLIKKSNGERVTFNPEKIRATIMRAGASDDLADRVLRRVQPKVRDGMATRRLFAIVHKELRRESQHLAQRYNLRTALLRLGPAGFKFEKYVASILNAYEYAASVPEQDYVGLCVRHEVDVVATKGGRSVVIEAKFRNRFADTVTLRDALATWARYNDLRDGAETNRSCPLFDEIWIVTNGTFSDRAMQFGQCRGINMVGWRMGQSLAEMVDHTALYPITVIDSLRQWELERFAKNDLLLCREVVTEDPDRLSGRLQLPRSRTRQIWEECRAVVGSS
ncbi:hypothetical protein COY93_04335 [Candidatus Uhrbacteria bacterium CG_4_10_14_0_8_um_filter_58_22]|uniref:ATP-cone domain-containing protein n=1 Tax=Candidatus Uhrbacteria bacterium CG_4_10_14_0_8_um_filter_58_22 TaxID=1975029 RepID=A0A2M7Q9S5_9BACT|nr:MAG: hypothetical protein AUJ19_02195 [Parcubacteria group bacterium CG1_02_58_44]PIY61944.1 MAG: hypothetical protein COY93_04335 [Candidatus Uhrbacteria bacterium CG_4_10_14_0_8_um_filter_58_22]